MMTSQYGNAERIRTLLRAAPGGELSADGLAKQTGLSPNALNEAVGLLRIRGQVFVDDSLGSAPYTFHSVILR